MSDDVDRGARAGAGQLTGVNPLSLSPEGQAAYFWARDQKMLEDKEAIEEKKRRDDSSSWIFCFGGATLIKTPHGDTRIDSLRKDDMVLSWNAASQELVERPVKKLIESGMSSVYHLSYEGRKAPVIVTANHPLMTDKGWKPVDKLSKGDVLIVMKDGNKTLAPITGIDLAEKREPVYNLNVAGDHNYIADDLVAHSYPRFRLARSVVNTAVERTTDFVHRLASARSVLTPTNS